MKHKCQMFMECTDLLKYSKQSMNTVRTEKVDLQTLKDTFRDEIYKYLK
jgi:hypothetical protein